jgi:hypothetical protein
MPTLAPTTIWWSHRLRSGIFSGTADLIELLEQLDKESRVTGYLCKYVQVAYDRGFIRLRATEPADLDRTRLYCAEVVVAEVTDRGFAWMDETLRLNE